MLLKLGISMSTSVSVGVRVGIPWFGKYRLEVGGHGEEGVEHQAADLLLRHLVVCHIPAVCMVQVYAGMHQNHDSSPRKCVAARRYAAASIILILTRTIDRFNSTAHFTKVCKEVSRSQAQ